MCPPQRLAISFVIPHSGHNCTHNCAHFKESRGRLCPKVGVGMTQRASAHSDCQTQPWWQACHQTAANSRTPSNPRPEPSPALSPYLSHVAIPHTLWLLWTPHLLPPQDSPTSTLTSSRLLASHLLQGHSCVSQGHTASCVFSPHGVSLRDVILLKGALAMSSKRLNSPPF